MHGEALGHIHEALEWCVREQHDTLAEDYIILLRKKAEILLMGGERREACRAYERYFELQRRYAIRHFSTMPEQWRLDFWQTLKPNICEIFSLEQESPDFLLDVALFRREVALLGAAGADEVKRRLGFTGRQLRRALRRGEVAIDFVRYQRDDTTRYAALLVPAASTRQSVQFLPLWSEEELHGFQVYVDSMMLELPSLCDTVTLHEALCSASVMDKDLVYSHPELAHFVWDRLEAELARLGCHTLYFAPDGLINLFAIEYLRGDEGTSTHRLSSLVRLLHRKSQPLSADCRMLSVGGLSYNLREEEGEGSPANHQAIDYILSLPKEERPFPFGSLSATRDEVENIQSVGIFIKETTQKLTERQLKEALHSQTYDILHLSTHAYACQVDVPSVPECLRDSVSEDRSLLASGIVLTGANVNYRCPTLEDGIFSARECCDFDLSGVRLVVLSACQSGIGRFSDEGPAGLVRGLKKAGAGMVIASLWQVFDDETMHFMSRLYQELDRQSRLDIHAAFHAARQELKSYPRYRNAFILIDVL